MNATNSRNGIRDAFRTVGRGFLLGVGFSVALGAAYVIAWQWTMNKTQEAVSDAGLGGDTTAKELLVTNVEEQVHDGVTSIIGSVKNSGKKPAHSVQVQANLFDHGKFVDQYSTYATGTLGPGESRYFKISCGCKDTPPAKHDSYKVELLGGY